MPNEGRWLCSLIEEIHHLLEGDGNTKVPSKVLDNLRILVVHRFRAISVGSSSRNRRAFRRGSGGLKVHLLRHRRLRHLAVSRCLLNLCQVEMALWICIWRRLNNVQERQCLNTRT